MVRQRVERLIEEEERERRGRADVADALSPPRPAVLSPGPEGLVSPIFSPPRAGAAARPALDQDGRRLDVVSAVGLVTEGGRAGRAAAVSLASVEALAQSADAVAATGPGCLAARAELSCLQGSVPAVLAAAAAVEAMRRDAADEADPAVARATARVVRALVMSGQLLPTLSLASTLPGHGDAGAESPADEDPRLRELEAVLAAEDIRVERGSGCTCQRCGASLSFSWAAAAVASSSAGGRGGAAKRVSDPGASRGPARYSVPCSGCGSQVVPRLRVEDADGAEVWAEVLGAPTLRRELQAVSSGEGAAVLHVHRLRELRPALHWSVCFSLVHSLGRWIGGGPDGCRFLVDPPTDSWLVSRHELGASAEEEEEDGAAEDVARDGAPRDVLLLPAYAVAMLAGAGRELGRVQGADDATLSAGASAAPRAAASPRRSVLTTPTPPRGASAARSAPSHGSEASGGSPPRRSLTPPMSPIRSPALPQPAAATNTGLRSVAAALESLRAENASLRAEHGRFVSRSAAFAAEAVARASAAHRGETERFRGEAMAAKAELLRARARVHAVVRVRPARSAAAGSALVLDGSDVEVAAGVAAGRFSFDRVLGQGCGQDRAWDEAEPAVAHALFGGTGCVLAYGQTGSGKTHTMGLAAGGAADGVVPRSIGAVLADGRVRRGELWLVMSAVEVHNDGVADLLADGRPRVVPRRAPRGAVELTGAVRARVSSLGEGMALVASVAGRRATSSTAMNDESSRSHAVVVMELVPAGGAAACVGKLVLADLAGSERLKRTGAMAAGDEDAAARAREAGAINRSLSALGNVMQALAKSDDARRAGKQGAGAVATHVPWRDSLLTTVLADAVGPGAATVLLATVAPDAPDAPETVRTLQFAERARSVRAAGAGAGGGGSAKLRKRLQRSADELSAARRRISDLESALALARASAATRPEPPGTADGDAAGTGLRARRLRSATASSIESAASSAGLSSAPPSPIRVLDAAAASAAARRRPLRQSSSPSLLRQSTGSPATALATQILARHEAFLASPGGSAYMMARLVLGDSGREALVSANVPAAEAAGPPAAPPTTPGRSKRRAAARTDGTGVTGASARQGTGRTPRVRYDMHGRRIRAAEPVGFHVRTKSSSSIGSDTAPPPLSPSAKGNRSGWQ